MDEDVSSRSDQNLESLMPSSRTLDGFPGRMNIWAVAAAAVEALNLGKGPQIDFWGEPHDLVGHAYTNS
jgi:hypothetical protein